VGWRTPRQLRRVGRELITTLAGCILGKPLRLHEIADPTELLDIARAAAFLNVSETSLRRWTNAGALPCLRIGLRRERRFRRADLLAFMEQPASAQRPARREQDSMDAPEWREEPIAAVHGNHLCGIYGSDAGRLDLSLPFLLEGLRKKSVCFLVAPSRTQRDILKAMKRKRPSLDSDIKAGRLIVTEHQNSPAAQCRFFEIAMTKAEAEGVNSFRVVGDMWGLRLKVSAREMVKLELGFERLIVPRFPVTALCAYDARKFAGVELLDALKAHDDTFRFPMGKTLA
jgi:excisionase family DNA binding protein